MPPRPLAQLTVSALACVVVVYCSRHVFAGVRWWDLVLAVLLFLATPVLLVRRRLPR